MEFKKDTKWYEKVFLFYFLVMMMIAIVIGVIIVPMIAGILYARDEIWFKLINAKVI